MDCWLVGVYAIGERREDHVKLGHVALVDQGAGAQASPKFEEVARRGIPHARVPVVVEESNGRGCAGQVLFADRAQFPERIRFQFPRRLMEPKRLQLSQQLVDLHHHPRCLQFQAPSLAGSCVMDVAPDAGSDVIVQHPIQVQAS